MRDPGRVVVLGAGPAGLGAAHRLAELGISFDLLEQRAGPGGLASSYTDEAGFTWDVGGHVQFSHYAAYDAMLDGLGGEWLEHERESAVWSAGRWVPYPFQYNLHRLPAAERTRALAGLERLTAAPPPGPARDFREWIHHTFGEGIAELFMLPYNEKVWGYPLETLDSGWIGERVAIPELARVRRGLAEGVDDVSWGPNNRFRFPRRGGTGWIWHRLAERLPAGRLHFGSAVAAVDLARRTLRVANGASLGFDALISTLPLDCLCRLAGDDLSPRAAAAAAALRHSAVHVIGVGLRGPRPEPSGRQCWMYFPGANSPYYRVTVFSNYSPHHVPAGEGYWSLMAEVCETAHRPVDGATLAGRVVAAMREDGLVAPDTEVVSLWHHREEHGYPTPVLGRDAALAAIRSELEPRGVYSRGRFGAWKYEVSNQDHSFMQGVEVVDRLAGLGEEPTLEQPGLVNGGAFAAARSVTSGAARAR